MFDELAINHVWFGVGIWIILDCSDYVLTRIGASWSRAGECHLQSESEESYELNPAFKKEMSEHRWFSPNVA